MVQQCTVTYGRGASTAAAAAAAAVAAGAGAAAAAAALAAQTFSALEGLPRLRFPSWGWMLWVLRFFGLACGVC